MKMKSLSLALLLGAGVMLTACQPKWETKTAESKTVSSQSSTAKTSSSTASSSSSAKSSETKPSQSSTESSSSSQPQDPIYPSLYGSWENANGKTLTVEADGSLTFADSKGRVLEMVRSFKEPHMKTDTYSLELAGYKELDYIPANNNPGKFLIGDKERERLLIQREDLSDLYQPGEAEERIFYRKDGSPKAQTPVAKPSGLDMAAIASGDFSSMLGSYETTDGLLGLEFLADGTTRLSNATNNWEVSYINFSQMDGYVKFSESAGPTQFLVVPAGVGTPPEVNQFGSFEDDSSRNRIIVYGHGARVAYLD